MVAMLSLQADSLDEGSAAAAALKDAGGRFRSTELLYEQLYRTESHERMSTNEYLTELFRSIVELYPNRSSLMGPSALKGNTGHVWCLCLAVYSNQAYSVSLSTLLRPFALAL
jgi:hypothetical protein